MIKYFYIFCLSIFASCSNGLHKRDMLASAIKQNDLKEVGDLIVHNADPYEKCNGKNAFETIEFIEFSLKYRAMKEFATKQFGDYSLVTLGKKYRVKPKYIVFKNETKLLSPGYIGIDVGSTYIYDHFLNFTHLKNWPHPDDTKDFLLKKISYESVYIKSLNKNEANKALTQMRIMVNVFEKIKRKLRNYKLDIDYIKKQKKWAKSVGKNVSITIHTGDNIKGNIKCKIKSDNIIDSNKGNYTYTENNIHSKNKYSITNTSNKAGFFNWGG